jgi:hypothetical protein
MVTDVLQEPVMYIINVAVCFSEMSQPNYQNTVPNPEDDKSKLQTPVLRYNEISETQNFAFCCTQLLDITNPRY